LWSWCSPAAGSSKKTTETRAVATPASPAQKPAATLSRELNLFHLTMMGVGLVIGLAGVAAAGRLLASELYQVPSADPMAIAGTAAVVAMVAVLASLIPALRAARLDPITVLRSE